MTIRCSVLVAASGMLLGTAASAQQLYFADIFNPTLADGAIKRINLDGSGLETVITIGGGLRSLDVDVAGGKIYWVDADNFAVRRCNLDGTGQEDLITTGLGFPASIRLHLPSQTYYFGDAVNEFIYYAPIAGGNPGTFTSTAFFRGLAIDADELFWTTSITPTSGNLVRHPLSGTSSLLVSGSGKPGNVAIHRAGGFAYYTDSALRSVRRVSLSGGTPETIFTHPSGLLPRGIAVDPAGGRLYVGQDVDDENPFGAILSMNLDGTDVQTFLQSFEIGKINDVVIVAGGGPNPCYPNCDQSTQVPILNVQDFTCFLQRYAAGESYANCDNSTQEPVLNVQDFTCFLQAYAQGCP